MKDLTLLILAAGMGSRFGGLKQVEPIGPNGEFIIDYSIYDAIECGFTKVVFIIKEENYELFKETVGKRIEDKIKVEYVFQNNDNVSPNYDLKDRIKPLGTAHAIMCSSNKIDSNFAIINADDFYGRDAFKTIADFLKNEVNDKCYGMVLYKVKNTITLNGTVKRGICKIKDNYLEGITESSIMIENNKIMSKPLAGGDYKEIDENTLVSMNMLGFTPSIFKYIENNFIPFLEENKNNLETCEYLIPDVLEKSINEGYAKVKVLPTIAKWEGVTYKEDKEKVVLAIQKLIDEGVYPHNLWKK